VVDSCLGRMEVIKARLVVETEVKVEARVKDCTTLRRPGLGLKVLRSMGGGKFPDWESDGVVMNRRELKVWIWERSGVVLLSP
jgi:hypothetical protein